MRRNMNFPKFFKFMGRRLLGKFSFSKNSGICKFQYLVSRIFLFYLILIVLEGMVQFVASKTNCQKMQERKSPQKLDRFEVSLLAHFMQKSGGGGGITTFRSKFLVSQYRKFRWGTLRCIRKFRVSKNFMHQRGGRGIIFSVKIFLSHSTEKFRWGTLRCFRKFRVSQNFMHKKRISLNSVENFLSHSAEKLRKGTL